MSTDTPATNVTVAENRQAQVGSPPRAPTVPLRILTGLLGIFISAMMSGMNNRVGALSLADIKGIMGAGYDDGSWLSTAYSVGELIVMPFASWFAITLSLRRFHLIMVSTCGVIAVILPFVDNFNLLIALRFVQGMSGGALIPILMMAALKILPLHIRLHGLALYAMTATFAPNLSIWLAGFWTDSVADWRWIYWQIIPLSLLSAGLVAWGIPKGPITVTRFPQANWLGITLGLTSLIMVSVALEQGIRLNWFHSPWIVVGLIGGGLLFVCYLITEWYNKLPFIMPQLLKRRNLAMGSFILLALMVVLMSGSMLPSVHLGAMQSYRNMQLAPLGLMIALPQLVLGSLVALLLYKKWVDARKVLSIGLVCIACACYIGSKITPDWNHDQFILTQILQAIGQPMAVISILFLMTSVLDPSEGPFFAGTINTLRVIGTLCGGAFTGQILTLRQRFHHETLLDHATYSNVSAHIQYEPGTLNSVINHQSLVMSVADSYLVLGVLALMLIPVALKMTFVPAPSLNHH